MSGNSTIVIVGLLGAIGCKHPDTKDPQIEECTPLPNEECTEDTGGDETVGAGGEETASDETSGDGTTGGDVAVETLESGECVHNFKPEVLGYRMQCEGELYTTIEFELTKKGLGCADVLDDCSERHVFGPSNDNYEAPDVMACCGEDWDVHYSDNYFQYCIYDLIQQTCASLAKRLEGYVLDGTFGGHADQGAALQNWIAENYKLCFESLRYNDSNQGPGALESHWKIPNSSKWQAIQNLIFRVRSGTEVTGVFRPASSDDWIACHGANGNNDSVFESPTVPDGGIIAGVELHSPILGELVGPTIFGGTVTASAIFASSCLPHGCPAATFSYDIDYSFFTLEDLNLYTTSFIVTNGVAWKTIDRARVELWGQARGTPSHGFNGQVTAFTIPPGEALFLITGSSDGYNHRFIGSNPTAIEIVPSEHDWVMDPFDIVYEDGAGRVWTLTLEESTWK